MTDTRLIERWLPIAALGEESVRERRSMTALPPTYYLHVWWARRPLVASRAAILASLLPETANREAFLHVLGIHGDPVQSRRRINLAKRQGKRFEGEAYSYPRAFSHLPTEADHAYVKDELGRTGRNQPVIADPTAGGGSIPFEAVRLGFEVYSNDLNPVASVIQRATIQYPAEYGSPLLQEFKRLSTDFSARRDRALKSLFPAEPDPKAVPTNFIWARTVCCPYCDGIVPLAPNWRLAPDGAGIRLIPHVSTGPGGDGRVCSTEIVDQPNAHSPATVDDGDATCAFPDCRRVIDGDEIKIQAQAGKMGEQLVAVVFRRPIEKRLKSGRLGKPKWVRGYRSPREEDDIRALVNVRLEEKMAAWQAKGYVPTEDIGAMSNYDRGHRMYGMNKWSDLFNPRQFFCHVTSVDIFNEMLLEEKAAVESKSGLTKAAFVYLAITIDKMVDYNSRISAWHGGREVTEHTFRDHAFVLKWAYSEMVQIALGHGVDWASQQTAKSLKELIALIRPDGRLGEDLLNQDAVPFSAPPMSFSCQSGDSLLEIGDGSVDVVVMDPPYYDNVMYAELSDFFYVWLKRTAGQLLPELFTRQLTDKDREAVANVAKFDGQKGAKALAGRDYQDRMARIFQECKRILKPDGLMTLMFTHKATGAWDALTTGLMHAGFSISSSWPINTESESSLHIKNKSAANSTIFLVCRPRGVATADSVARYWEDVEPLVAAAVKRKVKEFQEAGIGGVDLYLACFGPALEEFSRHWPLKRGTPRTKPEQVRRRRQAELFEEEWDPYAVTPEDALDAARREVKNSRLEQLTHMKANTEVDPLTAWFVLAWDAFKAPVFPYDEALRLARAVGVDLDSQVVGVLAEKDGSDLVLWDSAARAAKGLLGSPDGTRAMIDAVHHAAHVGRTRTLQAAEEMLSKSGVDREPTFLSALEAVLEVLPVSKAFSGIELEGHVASAGSDFEALENLRRMAFSKQVDQPKQLDLWRDVAPG